MFARLEYRIRFLIRAGLTQLISALLALGFIVVGIVFFLMALWVALEQAHGTVFAALAVGGAFVGVGLLVLVVGLLMRPRPLPPPPVAYPMAEIVAAFLQGMQAARGPAKPDPEPEERQDP